MSPTSHARAWTRILPVAVLSALVATSVSAPADAVIFRKTFSQTTPVNLGDGPDGPNGSTSAIPDSGPAATYPTQDTWSATQPIVDVNVYINLTHTNPDDVELLLVGPGGQQALLMANAGGGADFSGQIAFDDEAATAVPDNDPLVSNESYRPVGYSPTALPAPAPALNGNSALSVFDGTNPTGTWSVYAYDDAIVDSGSFSWYVELVTGTTPYPSAINVSGLGSVTDVNVSLDNLTTTYSDDIDLLLVGPQGQQSTLMSDVGGSNDLTNVDVTVDDEAATPFPDEALITAGSYQPANIEDQEDVYPAPAPAPTGSTALSAFDGTNPNGTWRLFAWDSVGGDYASIAGWSLDIESNDAAAPTGSVSIAAGAATVDSTAVTLTLAATDPAPGTGLASMRFSNDGKTFSAFQPYAATAAWNLAPGKDGSRTVYAQFADGVGNIGAVVADTVTLDTTSPTAKKIKPAKNATGVKPTVKIKVVASEKLDPATVTAKSVVLKQGSKKVKAKVSLKKGTTIVLKPKKDLVDGKYKVTVSKTVTDLVGNAFDAKKKKGIQTLKWSFTV